MIQQSEKASADTVPFSISLKATLQSIFRFAEDKFPKNSARIEPSSITYINHKSLLEMVRKTISTIKSDVLPIEPAGLKDTLFVTCLSLAHMQYHLNLLETRLAHLWEYLSGRFRWRRYIKWTRTNKAFRHYQLLKEQQRDSRRIWEQLNRAYRELRHTIRHSALAIVKADVSSTEGQFIIDIEKLESSRTALLELLYEIEDQQHRKQKLRKIFFYASDRLRIYNKFRGANLALENLSIQLERVDLDNSFITLDLLKEIHFKERKRIRWYISDKYVLRQLDKRQFPLKTLIDGLDRLLQSESHKLNLYANQVTNLGYLLRFTPTPSIAELPGILVEKDHSPPLPSPTPGASKNETASANEAPHSEESSPTSVVDGQENGNSVLTLSLEEIDEPSRQSLEEDTTREPPLPKEPLVSESRKDEAVLS